MATVLSSLVIRESSDTDKPGGRNILVALTPDQRISFRLKGMKSGTVSIEIKKLYEQLTGEQPEQPKRKVITGAIDLSPEALITRLRTKNATHPGNVELISRLDGFFAELLKEIKS